MPGDVLTSTSAAHEVGPVEREPQAEPAAHRVADVDRRGRRPRRSRRAVAANVPGVRHVERADVARLAHDLGRARPRARGLREAGNENDARSGHARILARAVGAPMSGRDATTSFAATLVDEWARAGRDRRGRRAGLAVGAARPRARPRRPPARARRARRALGRVPRARARPRERPAGRACCARRAPRPRTSIRRWSRRRTRACRCSCAPPTVRRSCATRARARRSTRRISTAARCAGSAIPGPPTDEPGAGATWRALASRAVAETLGPPAGPVHLNLPFREPLLPTGAPLVDAPGRAGGRPWTRLDARDARAARRPTSPRLADARARASARAAGRGVGRRRAARDRGPVRRRGRLAGARRPDLATARRDRSRSRPTRRCCARPASPTRTVPISSCASARRSRARSRPRGSTRRSGRCWSIRDGAWLDPHRAAERALRRRTPTPLLAAVADALGHRRRASARG